MGVVINYPRCCTLIIWFKAGAPMDPDDPPTGQDSPPGRSPSSRSGGKLLYYGGNEVAPGKKR